MKSKLVCALLPTLLAGAASARESADFTRPVPSLAEALGAARAALDRRLAALRDAEAINSLAYVALKAGAALAARHIADRLRPISADSPPLLDTLAELRYSEGRIAEALAIERRALALGGDSYGGIYKRHLARFRRGGKEQPDEIAHYEAPQLGELRRRAQP